MHNLIADYLEEILDEVRDHAAGEIPTYISSLTKADPEWLGIAMCTTSGRVYEAGDTDVSFTIQSVSKPFIYALALQECGLERVLDVAGMEPSGEAFNELSLREEDKRPLNPMINAGAIAVNQLINGEESPVADRVEVILDFMSRLAGRPLELDEESAVDELEKADRNLSIAHMLRSHDVIVDAAHDAVDSYTRQCSALVTLRDLAVMSGTLANGGVQPVTGEKLLDPEVCRQTLSVMSSCGMYDAAGRWMARVGIPAKSGVSGGLIGTLPGQLGLSTLSPRLNPQGNSVRGVKIFEQFSEEMGLHLMASDPVGAHAVRAIETEGEETTVQLQGSIHFAAAERALDKLSDYDFDCQRIVLDVSRVSGFEKVGRVLVKEGLRRLRDEGFEIAIYDPEEMFGDLEFADGTHAEVAEGR